jgi:hypothetical protein
MSSSLYYNPDGTNSNVLGINSSQLGCDSGRTRKVSVVKVDSLGNIVWNFIYGSDTSNVNWQLDRYTAWDLVEYYHNATSRYKIRVVGNVRSVLNASTGGTQSFMMDINADNGRLNWQKLYNPPSTTGSQKNWYAIEKKIVGIETYIAAVGNEKDSINAKLNAAYYNANSSTPDIPMWDTTYYSSDSLNDFAIDFIFDKAGDLLIPVIYNCKDCEFSSDNNYGGARLVRFDDSLGTIMSDTLIADFTISI